MKTKSGLVRIALLAVAGGFGWSAAPAAAGEDTLEIEVRLLGALGAGGDTSLPALLLDLTRTGDRWERVWGVHSDNRKPALYAGCVRKAEVGGDRVTFAIQMWHRDLSGIEMDLRRAADGELQGTYTVNVGTNAVKGRADGRIKPKRPALPAGVAPAKPGERPRILVRASEIPALKKKIETPAGKAAFEKMGDEKTADAIGQGLKYALTGDKEYADKAMVFAEKNMTGNPGGYSMRSSGKRSKSTW